MTLRLGVGLALAGLWAVAVWMFSPNLGWLADLALIVAILPLLALSLLRERLPSRWREGLGPLTPLTLLWALNYPALTSWWIRDDPCHLVKILEHGLWRPFVSSIGGFLTPWLNLSLGADFVAFGLEPSAFYLHQLLAFSVLVIAGYLFSRLYLTSAGSSLAMGLFVVSVPSFAVVRLLMNRHYLEGLILVLVSLALYRRAVESRRWPPALLGAAFYLLATTTKEVFVPLILVLPFLARGSWIQRVRFASPYAVSAGIYGIWRLYMLGWSNSLSGYGALGGEFRFEALGRIPALLGLNHPWQKMLALAVALVMASFIRRHLPWQRRRDVWLALGIGLLALGAPLIPVAARLEPRHFFLPWFVVALWVAAAVGPKNRDEAADDERRVVGRALAMIVLLIGALASLTGSYFWHRFEPAIVHHRAEGSFVLDESSKGLLMTTVNHSTFLECLARLRQEVLGRAAGPGFCGDSCYCAERFPDEERWRFTDGQLLNVERATVSCGESQLLDVELSHDQNAHRMSWTFGPHSAGAYEVLLISGGEAPGISIPVALPRQGSMPYWLSGALRFVVKHRSLEGEQTYSPVYVVEPDGRAIIER